MVLIFKSVSKFNFLIGFMIVNGNLVSRQWSFLKLFELVKIIQITFIEFTICQKLQQILFSNLKIII